jgi:hypothetical protein
MLMATTAFPAVVAGIISQLKASSDLSAVRIFDGIEVDSTYPGDFIAVGHDGSDDGDVTAVSLTQTYDQIGAKKMFEDGSVDCFLASWDGTTDLTSRRTRAFALMSAVDTAIRLDPSLSGSCLFAGIAQSTTSYRQTNAGVAVVISFTITYKART